jgi:hypothetical protein
MEQSGVSVAKIVSMSMSMPPTGTALTDRSSFVSTSDFAQHRNDRSA